MQRREKPKPEPIPIDRIHVRELLEAVAADHNFGVDTHHHPALQELGDLFGVMAEYGFAFMAYDHQITSRDLDELENRIVRLAPAWKAGPT